MALSRRLDLKGDRGPVSLVDEVEAGRDGAEHRRLDPERGGFEEAGPAVALHHDGADPGAHGDESDVGPFVPDAAPRPYFSTTPYCLPSEIW